MMYLYPLRRFPMVFLLSIFGVFLIITSYILYHVPPVTNQYLLESEGPIKDMNMAIMDYGSNKVPVIMKELDYTKEFDYSFLPLDRRRPNLNFEYDTQSTQLQKRPMLSIITAFYNGDELLHHTAQCALGSTMMNVEWILVNDQSDSPLGNKLVDFYRLRSKQDPRIIVVDNIGDGCVKGLPGARNTGIKFATAPYLMFLDDDDQVELTYAEKCIWFLETHPDLTMCHSFLIAFDYSKFHSYGGFHSGDKNINDNSLTVQMVMRRDVLLEVGVLDSGMTMGAEDWDLWLRFAERGYWGYTIPELLIWYRTSQPGKWSGLLQENLDKFRDHARQKYPGIFTHGVPKLHRHSKTSATPQRVVHNAIKRVDPHILAILGKMEGSGSVWHTLLMLHSMALHGGWRVTVVVTEDTEVMADQDKREHAWEWQFKRVTHDIHVLPKFLERPQWGEFLLYLIKSRNPSIVLCHQSLAAFELVPSLKRHAPYPLFVDYVPTLVHHRAYPNFAEAASLTRPWLDRTICGHTSVRQQLIQHEKYTPSRIGVVNRVIDGTQFRVVGQVFHEVRDQFSIDVMDPVIVCTGLFRSIVVKRIVDTISRLSIKRFHVFIVSEDDSANLVSDYLPSELRSKFSLLPFTPYPKMIRILVAADIFFQPDWGNSFDVSVSEMIALEVCPVMQAVGGPKFGTYPITVKHEGDVVAQYSKIIDSFTSNIQKTRDETLRCKATLRDLYSSDDLWAEIRRELSLLYQHGRNHAPNSHQRNAHQTYFNLPLSEST